jgi:4-hydroxy-2-oxoheptanedioate aldolase
MIDNSILSRNRQGRKASVLGLAFPATPVVELAAQVGFDAIYLDGEHGTFTPESVDVLCRVANGYGLSVVARVPSLDGRTIGGWLDRGVQTIIGPRVETEDQARGLADACRFPPEGSRSWGGGRATAFGDRKHLDHVRGGAPTFAQWSNANVLVFGQIESVKGYQNLDAILAVEGLTGLAGGPYDFAASLGHTGQPDHPERRRLSADVERRAREAGKCMISDVIALADHVDLLLVASRDFLERHAGEPAPAIGGRPAPSAP